MICTVAAAENFGGGIEGAKCISEEAKIQKSANNCWFWQFFDSGWGAACVGGRASDWGKFPHALDAATGYIIYSTSATEFSIQMGLQSRNKLMKLLHLVFNRIVIGWHKQLEPCWMTEILLQRYLSDKKRARLKGYRISREQYFETKLARTVKEMRVSTHLHIKDIGIWYNWSDICTAAGLGSRHEGNSGCRKMMINRIK